PEGYNFVRDVLDQWAREPGKLAMLWVDDSGQEARRTFADLTEASRRLCNVLVSGGVKRGDTVIVVLARRQEWWETMTACLRMGAVASPGTTQLSARDLQYRINASHATCVVTDLENAHKVDSVLKECPTVRLRIIVGGSL